MLATIRPDSWNFPLLLHVLGAMVLVGAAATAVTAEFVSVGSEDPGRLRRVAFRTMLFVGVPAFFLMHAAAEWIHSKEFGKGSKDPTWVDIGYITADGGGFFLLIALVLGGIASRRNAGRLGQAAGVFAAIALGFWLVAVWAMGGKPD